MARETAVIVGAGGGLGAALARRFAHGGLAVAVARRDAAALAPIVDDIERAGGAAHAYGVDATNEAQVEDLFARAETELGPVRAAIFNASTLVMKPAAETETEEFRALWETCCLGGFLTGRAAARRMLGRGQGAIFFTGSREAWRGFANLSAHVSAKFGLRGLAQCMARELGPQGIHVAHVVIDGLIDSPHTRLFLEGKTAFPETLLNPDHIAENYWSVYEQPRDAWTFELDLRPFSQQW